MTLLKPFGSTTARIALAVLLAQIITVGLALLLMHSYTQRMIAADARQFVAELSADISDEFESGGPSAATQAIVERLQAVVRRDAIIALRAPDGTIAIGNIDKWPHGLAANVSWREVSLVRSGAVLPEVMGLQTKRLASGYQLLTGQAMEGEKRLRQISETSFLVALMVGVFLAGWGSWFLARFIGGRVDHISAVAEDFGQGQLAARTDIDGTGDAFDRLGNAINAMFERIQVLVLELRLVTDALAHDLRSPVARLKSTVERALTLTVDETSLSALGTVSNEADSLLKMLTVALQISRAEAGIGRNQFSAFDISDMLRDLVELYGPLAEEEGFTLSAQVPETMMIFAHRELLGQAIANLIDNALKYAKPGSAISLCVSKAPNSVTVAVADNGPGIPSNQIDEALRRFSRLDSARQAGGAGLGLSLVRTIAHLHGGTLELEDNCPGLRAVVSFPSLAAEPLATLSNASISRKQDTHS